MKNVVEFPEQGAIADEAAEWLIRLDADTPPTREDRRALGEWLQRSPAHREELESLAALWGRMNVLTELAVPLGKLGRGAAHTSRGRFAAPARSSWGRTGLLAASVATLVALGGFWLARGPATDPRSATYATAVGQQETATLADGSVVVLNTNSRIEVRYGDEYRDVRLLQGEALFTVAKDVGRPFRVYAGNGRIQALGTAFSVYLRGEDVKVTVTEGRVSLATVNRSRSLATEASASGSARQAGAGPGAEIEDYRVEPLGTLHAGQIAIIRNSAVKAAASTAALEIVESGKPEELARRLAWRDGILMFSGDTLEEVIHEISRYTTVSIEIPDPAVREMRVGGRFPVGETEAMLAALETNFNLRVTRVSHDRVVISDARE